MFPCAHLFGLTDRGRANGESNTASCLLRYETRENAAGKIVLRFDFAKQRRLTTVTNVAVTQLQDCGTRGFPSENAAGQGTSELGRREGLVDDFSDADI